MKSVFLIKKETNKIVLFFGGWATEPAYFRHLQSSDYSVCMFYDYSNDIDLKSVRDIASHYKEVNVVAWSFGVWVANRAMQNVVINKAIAINGTLQPVDNQYGIPDVIFNRTVENLSEISRRKFNLRMCGSKEAFQKYSRTKTQRTFDDIRAELVNLKKLFETHTDNDNIFNSSIISKNDNIFPLENQKAFWEKKIEIKIINSSHFPFFDFDNWNKLID